MKTKDKYKPSTVQRLELPSEIIFRQACKTAVVLGESLFHQEVAITHCLRSCNDMSAVTATKIGIESGVSADHMAKLVTIARSQPGEWCEWISGARSIAAMIAMISAREQKQREFGIKES